MIEITDATAVTMSLGMLATVSGGVSAWAVALYRLRQAERQIQELEEARDRGRERRESEQVKLRDEIRNLEARLIRLESSGVPMIRSDDPTPVLGLEPRPRRGRSD